MVTAAATDASVHVFNVAAAAVYQRNAGVAMAGGVAAARRDSVSHSIVNNGSHGWWHSGNSCMTRMAYGWRHPSIAPRASLQHQHIFAS